MRHSAAAAFSLAVSAILLAHPLVARAQASPRPLASVYGLEFESPKGRDRVLIFSDAEREHQLREIGVDRLLLRIEDAELDPSLEPRIVPPPGGPVKEIRAFEARTGSGREVRVEIVRRPGTEYVLEARGALIALDFPRTAKGREKTFNLAFRDKSIREVVTAVAAETGDAFIFDESVSGRVTLHTPARVTADEARELLNVALHIKGFAVVPAPEGRKRIVPITDVSEHSRWTLGSLDESGEGPIATIIPLRAANVDDVVAMATQGLVYTTILVPFHPTNSLILAGTENMVRRVIGIVNELDEAASVDLALRHLRHRSTEFVSGVVRESFDVDGTGPSQIELWTDERTNTVIYRARKDRIAEVRALIDELDQPVEGRGNIRVYRMRFADPETMAQTLNEMATVKTESVQPSEDQEDEITVVSNKLMGRDYYVAEDAGSSALIIRAAPEVHDLIDSVLAALDVAPPRISVDIVVAEISTDETLDLAVEAVIPVAIDKNEDIIITFFSDPDGGGFKREKVLGRIQRKSIELEIEGVPIEVPRDIYTIEARNVSATTQILLNPHLLMTSGEEQSLKVGDNIPVLVSDAIPEGTNSLRTQQRVERYDTGIDIRVTPTVAEAGAVKLDIDLEISQLSASAADADGELGPTIGTRKLNAVVWLRHHEVAQLAIVKEPISATITSGVPFLKSVPIFGFLFRSTADVQRERRLLINVEARVLRSREDTVVEQIRRRIGFQRAIARTDSLRARPGAPYAVRVATKADRQSAEAIAEFLGAPDRELRVTSWKTFDVEYFDVYILNLVRLEKANALAREARAAGWNAEVVLLQMEFYEDYHRPIPEQLPSDDEPSGARSPDTAAPDPGGSAELSPAQEEALRDMETPAPQ